MREHGGLLSQFVVTALMHRLGALPQSAVLGLPQKTIRRLDSACFTESRGQDTEEMPR